MAWKASSTSRAFHTAFAGRRPAPSDRDARPGFERGRVAGHELPQELSLGQSRHRPMVEDPLDAAQDNATVLARHLLALVRC